MKTFSRLFVNHLYIDVLNELLGLESPLVAPRGMPVKEIVDAHITIHDPRSCVISLPERKLNYHFMVAEWWWIASGMSSVEPLSKFCNEIARFSDDGQTFFGAYGPPWRSQVDYVIAKLNEDVNSRQAVLTIWRQSPPRTKDVPCTVAMQYLIRDEQLVTIVTMRSSDAWLGLPYDIFNFARLGSTIAGEIGVKQGALHLNLGSLHLYERNFEAASKLSDIYKTAYVEESPTLDCLPGLLPQMAPAWMSQAAAGWIGTIREPWSSYLRVLAHRSQKDIGNVPGPWKHLINREIGL